VGAAGQRGGRSGDVGCAGDPQQCQDGVAQGGHGLWCCPGAQLVMVLAEGHVADPVQLVLDDPVPADELTDTGGVGLIAGRVAHRVDDLAGAGPARAAARAHDPCGQPRVREPQSREHRADQLDGAVLGASVSVLGAGVADGHLGPGQASEAGVQGWFRLTVKT